jgi:hypothetical protein
MSSIRCGACQRRRAIDDVVCLFCGASESVSSPTSTAREVGRFALRTSGAIALASAIVLAPVLLGACGCGGCGAPNDHDAGHTDAGPSGGDAGPPQR